MARRTKADALETRHRLLDAAETVFLDKGFSHTSLNDVAQAAQMTRGAVYWHFRNKADLLEALVERVRLPAENLSDCCAGEAEADPLGRLRDYAVTLLKETVLNDRRRRVFTILFHKFEFNHEAEDLEVRHQAAFLDSLNRIQQGLERAVAQGQLPEKLDTAQAAFAFQAYFIGVTANWLFMPRAFDLAANAEAMVAAFFDMLSTSQAMLSADQAG